MSNNTSSTIPGQQLSESLVDNAKLQNKNIAKDAILAKFLTATVWMFLAFSVIMASLNVTWSIDPVIKLNGFTWIIWIAVSLLSAIVHTYSIRYIRGSRFYNRFFLLAFFFTVSTMALVAVQHFFLQVLSWFFMGLIMSKLIGIVSDWGEARAAGRLAKYYFMTGTFLLFIALYILYYSTGAYTVDGMMGALPTVAYEIKLISSILIIVAALIQSSVFPFHKWLLSAMTAPTPASALMHAGFVNAAGILLAIFAPLLIATNMLLPIFIIGVVSACLAQFWKLVHSQVKQKLACSTVAQMSFMIVQCGLGFFTAAVAHLMLHGFYKAYLFLSAGTEIERTKPVTEENPKLNILQFPMLLISGLLGGGLFAYITGKGMAMDSGLFLTFIVVITVMHAVHSMLNQKELTTKAKLFVLPVSIISAISIYAMIYNGVKYLMTDLPMSEYHAALSPVHIIAGVLFFILFVFMLSGAYRNFPYIYVKMLNMSQPNPKTILAFKKSKV